MPPHRPPEPLRGKGTSFQQTKGRATAGQTNQFLPADVVGAATIATCALSFPPGMMLPKKTTRTGTRTFPGRPRPCMARTVRITNAGTRRPSCDSQRGPSMTLTAHKSQDLCRGWIFSLLPKEKRRGQARRLSLTVEPDMRGCPELSGSGRHLKDVAPPVEHQCALCGRRSASRTSHTEDEKNMRR